MVSVDSESVLIFVGRMLSPPFLKPLFQKSGHGILLTRIQTLVALTEQSWKVCVEECSNVLALGD